MLYDYPNQAAFKRVLPKSKIYEYAKPSRATRDLFVKQVDKIIWQYKLAPETINLTAKPGVPEIQIFSINLKTSELSEVILRTIDQGITFPIFYELEFQDRVKCVSSYKRPSEADSEKWVIDFYYNSSWLPISTERIPLPVALDMGKLYEQMLRPLMPISPRNGESLKTQAARLTQIRVKEHDIFKLETRLKNEKQFNRKVELNAQLREVKNDLNALIA